MTNSAIIEVLTERLGADGVARGADIGRKHYVDFSGEHPCAPVALARPTDAVTHPGATYK